MSDFSTIKGLAQKLAALSAPDSGATEGERANAVAALERLLARHNLTVNDLADEALHDVPFDVWSKAEEKILTQCAFFILDVKQLHRKVPVMWPRKRQQVQVVICGITQAQAADIGICFRHYQRELEKLVSDRRRQINELRTAIRKAPEAIIVANELFSSHAVESKRPMSLKQIREIVAAMKGVKPNPWERPAGKVESGTFALDWKGGSE